jgi:hypothetical protein
MDVIKVGGKHLNIKKIGAVKYQDGDHPKNINEGFETSGYCPFDIEVGAYAHIGQLRTSTVLEIQSDNQFATKNSIYEIQVINDPTLQEEKAAAGEVEILPYLDGDTYI